jgi:phosphoribosylanthranilate isomerase
MEATTHPRVKICCIASHEEAWMAIRAGASAIGLVSAMPSGPGVIEEATIAEVARSVPPSVSTFLLTSLREASTIAEQQRRLRTTAVQICDRVALGAYPELRRALPGIGLVQVVHVTGPESLEEAVRVGRGVDALLLDSGNLTLAVKELGGTGRRHDWRVSQEIRDAVAVPVFLAGGLTAENVAEAIVEVGAFGLDVCSGVRTDGRLDPRKLEAFFGAIRTTRA